MKTDQDLRKELYRIDGKGYKACKDIRGSYQFPNYQLFIDHVQGDPFAAPSKIRVRVSHKISEIPKELFQNKIRQIALQDFLAREVRTNIKQVTRGSRGMGKSGLISIDAGNQEVLERTAVKLTSDWVEVRLEVGLPAKGRTILGRQAIAMLCEELPQIAKKSLQWQNLPKNKAQYFVECIENQEFIRSKLEELNLVAFVSDDALLPRATGASDRPMKKEEAVLFSSPDSLRISIELPNPVSPNDDSLHTITGMGIPKGITLIVGGGYHGKSTLLRALERGVYPHIPGDGREYVVTNSTAVKIRAEDGRRVARVDISTFINNLPNGRSTSSFYSDDASGSTSQAANIVEAVEIGTKLLLLDEDTSATNFMVRDARMQSLVHKEDEPITPFLDRVRELHKQMGISTILVMGGSGDYLDVADNIITMSNYLPEEITREAKEVAETHPTHRHAEAAESLTSIAERVPLSKSFDPSKGKKAVKINAKGKDLILFGGNPIELRYVEQLVDVSQTRAIGDAIYLAVQKFLDGQRPLKEIVDEIEKFLNENGLDLLNPFHRSEQHPGNYARPRKFEIAAAINRLRTVEMRQV